jgi:iron complex outermembrane receptor protein
MRHLPIRRAVWIRAIVGVSAAAIAAPALAQQPAESVGNEIVVTATKREQTLQQVPVAVTVTTAEAINRAHIRDIKDLSTVVPSLRVSEHQSSAQTDFLIRGFGNGANNAGIEPSVGVFIDGVYRSRSAAQIADFPDVRRVEVLRGPQSTLFGKNASAGVVSITTADPQFKTGGSLDLSYGRFNALVAKGTITGPISENLAASLSGGYNRRDGTVHDAGTGADTNNRNRYFGRGQLLWAPDGGPRVRLIADYSRIDELCCGVVNLLSSSTTAALQSIGGKVNSPGNIYGDVNTNLNSTNKITDYGYSAQIDHTVAGVKLTSITAYRHNRNLTNQDSDFTSADLLGRNSADVGISTFTQELRAQGQIGKRVNFLAGVYYFNEKIGQTGQLQYGTQMRSYADLLIRGASGNAFNVTSLESTFGTLSGNSALYTGQFFKAGSGLSEAYHVADESISVFGQADWKVTDRLTLTGGLNYTHDAKKFWTGVQSSDVFSSLNLVALRNAATNAGIAQTIGGLMSVPGGYANATQIAAFAGANPAAYAAVTSGVAAQTAPLLGLRALQFMPPFLNVPNAVESGHTGDGNVSFTLRAAFDLSKQINVYASYGTGFKASSINLSRDSRPALSDAAAIVAGGLATTNLRYGGRYARPEESAVYEAGLKANWGVATVNFAAFYQEIKNFQSNTFTGIGFDLLNADKESVYGFEFEGSVKPTSELTLAESVTYLKPKFDSYTNSSFGNASGATPAGITPISSTFVVTWDHGLDSGHHVIVRADWHYESSVQTQDGMPGFITKDAMTGAVTSYQTGIDAARPFRREVSEFDASLTWKTPSRMEFSLWGRNLTNDRYLTVVFDSPAQSGSISGYVNQPRTYGVSALARF